MMQSMPVTDTITTVTNCAWSFPVVVAVVSVEVVAAAVIAEDGMEEEDEDHQPEGHSTASWSPVSGGSRTTSLIHIPTNSSWEF